VDPDVLARVLEEPDGRALLVDFVRLRAAVNADEDDEAARHPAAGYRLPLAGQRADSPLMAHGARPPVPGRSRGSRWLRVAAVFLLLATGAGSGAWVERYVSRERPPEPDRVVRLDPVPEGEAMQVARSEAGRQP
jgi:hypothetical protein